MNTYQETLPGGAMWSMRVPRHHSITLTALEAGANVSALFYNAHNPLDRLNVPDTLKALHTAKLTRGHILMSDMGLALASMVGDTLGWHDPLGGHADATRIEAQFGALTYQEARNGFHRNARNNFLVELSKHGLGERDIVANVNFFSKVTVDDAGLMTWHAGHCPAGASITLRTEINLLAVFSNTPHPMASGETYPFVPVEITIAPCESPAADDFCRHFRPECERTLALTERQFQFVP